MRGGLIIRRLGLVLAVLALAGCGRKAPREGEGASSAVRIVCGTPAVVEIVYALGCGDRVAGVSEFTDWPPEAAGKPQIGGALNPNRESILRLAPNLILSQGRSEALETFAHMQDIEFRSFPLDTLEDLRAAISGIAEVLGRKAQGQELLAGMDAGFAAIPRCGPVPVFIALGHAPGDLSGLMTSGPGTFLDQIVAKAGGSNLFADVNVLWPKISLEALIRRKPQIVLDFQTLAADEIRRTALFADWLRLGFGTNQVRILEEEYLLKPGPRAAQSAARIAAALCGP